MKKLLLTYAFLAAGLICSCTQKNENHVTSLFNGKDLTGRVAVIDTTGGVPGDACDFVCLGGARIAEVNAGPEVNFPVKKRNSPPGTIEKPDGEWNVAEVVCLGKNIKVYINDSFENECTAPEVAGYIALQSEGGPLEFKNIYIEQFQSCAVSVL